VKTPAESVNVAEAKKRFSDLLGRVAYGGETVVITRRGRPMAKLVPHGVTGEEGSLAAVRGWLADDDPFFERIDTIVGARARHRPRVLHGRRRSAR
jgi:prevent-host-death family protein